MSEQTEHDAMLWEPLDGRRVRCRLCGFQCVIPPGAYGRCRVRRNVAGSLKTLSYDNVVAMNVDPIEKKPLFHVLPGTASMSIAAAGCNFRCSFCQNWQISQAPRLGGAAGRAVSPARIVAGAIARNCASISYTYTEPTVFFELAYDTARLAHDKGLKNCFVSNGYMTTQAVEKIAPYLDAINVDLKAFRDETYRRVMKARLAPVLTCLKALVAAGIWLEVTTLVVPGINDSAAELGELAEFIAGQLGRHVPWHISRFHGDYEMTAVPSTPIETLDMACRLGADAGLMYVYGGNVAGRLDERTYCPSCGEIVIDRAGFRVGRVNLDAGRCSNCGRAIEGVWA